MRLREDELFIQRLTRDLPRALKSNLNMVDLNLKDAPIRLRIPLEEVSDTLVNPEDPAIEKIRKALARQAEAGSLEALVVPLALGNHVDHLTVRAAAMPLTTGLPSAFYEDLPYAATYPSATADLDALRDATASLDEPLVSVLCHTPLTAEAAIELKRHLALGYASQIDEVAAETIASFATRYNGGERIWANQRWLNAFTA
jgi:hypothetical protein